MTWPLRFPVLVIAIAIASTAFAGLGIPRLRIDSSIASMTLDSDADHETHRRYTGLFGSDEVLAVAISFNDPFSPQSIETQEQIAGRILALPDVAGVEALVTAEDIKGTRGAITVAPLIPSPFAADKQEILQRVRAHPLWPGLLLSKDEQSIAIHVTLEDSAGAEVRRGETLDAIEEILSNKLAEGTYHLAGHPYMKREIANAISRGLGRLLPITLGLMACVLFLALDWRTSIAVFSLVVASVTWMLGAMGWLDIPLTAVSNCAPAILLALSTAAFLHLPANLDSALSTAGPKPLERAVALTSRPVLIAGTTTVAGFCSLGISSVPIIRDFGLALGVGMVSCTIIALLVLPAALSIRLEHPSRLHFGSIRRTKTPLRSIAIFSTSHCRALTIGAAALAVACIFVAGQLEVDSSGPNKFPPDSRFRQSSEFYRQHFSGDVTENIYLSGPPGIFSDPEVLEGIGRLKTGALALAEVDHAASIRDVVVVLNREFLAGDRIAPALPDNPAAVSQLLLLYESERGDLSDFVSPDYSDARVALQAIVPSSSASAELRARLEALAREHLPTVPEIHVVSTEILLSRAADRIAVEQIQSASLALVVVLALVGLFFRSIKAAGLLILPNLLPILMNLASMRLMGIALSDATSIIAATTIGIAVDSSVHLIARATATNDTSTRQIRSAVEEVGQPILLAAIVVVLGFSALVASDFQAVRQLGALTAATMLYCLAADLFVLPAQMALGRSVQRRDAEENRQNS